MVVKIIKGGVNPTERVYECTCRLCGCIFSFSESDAVYTRDQRDGDFLTISCPECRCKCHKDVRK